MLPELKVSINRDGSLGSVSDLTSKCTVTCRAAKVLRDSKFAAVNNVSL